MSEWLTQIAASIESPLLLLMELILSGVTILTVGHVLLYKRNPRPAVMWVVVCLALPGFGALAYWMFGFNRISTRAQVLRDRWPVFTARGHHLNVAADAPSLPARFRELARIGKMAADFA